MSVSVCLSVCLHAYLTNYTSTLHQTFRVLPAESARRCDMLCTSGSVDDGI